jgi:hypothetical protein
MISRRLATKNTAVEYLAHKFGEGSLGGLLRDNAFGNIPKFDDLLRQITRMSIDDLDSAVDASLR